MRIVRRLVASRPTSFLQDWLMHWCTIPLAMTRMQVLKSKVNLTKVCTGTFTTSTMPYAASSATSIRIGSVAVGLVYALLVYQIQCQEVPAITTTSERSSAKSWEWLMRRRLAPSRQNKMADADRNADVACQKLARSRLGKIYRQYNLSIWNILCFKLICYGFNWIVGLYKNLTFMVCLCDWPMHLCSDTEYWQLNIFYIGFLQ